MSDIKHMAYATRLGLWGSANPLYPTFESFQGTLAKRGVGAMEMLALEMKRKGLFVARTLSWEGAEFHTLEVKLQPETIAVYDGAGTVFSLLMIFTFTQSFFIVLIYLDHCISALVGNREGANTCGV